MTSLMPAPKEPSIWPIEHIHRWVAESTPSSRCDVDLAESPSEPSSKNVRFAPHSEETFLNGRRARRDSAIRYEFSAR